MKLRMPAYPLITNDPNFNIWSSSDKLNESSPVHWTGKRKDIQIKALLEGAEYLLMGADEAIKKAEQLNCEVTAFTTHYTFKAGDAVIELKFTSPLLIDNIDVLSRPVTYMEILSDKPIKATVFVNEEICLDETDKGIATVSEIISDCKYPTVKIGSADQPVLGKSGDVICIDYGYFYLTSAQSGSKVFVADNGVGAEADVNGSALFTFAYDDIYAIEYFGEKLKSVWNNDGTEITQIIELAISEYTDILNRCDSFSIKIFNDALKSGGEKYAELIIGAYRQVMGAHKAAIDTDGNLLWISKECYSNGCGATVDITYPSCPLFLCYNTELVKAMMRPVFKYSRMPEWVNDFAPHDVGQFPLINGQFYCPPTEKERQMPVEECGNMVIVASAVAIIENDTDFIKENLDLLEKWVKYLAEKGYNPENQLCTDDFAGQLEGNCNLTLKAISALGMFSKVYKMLGEEQKAEEIYNIAQEMADKWAVDASNGDGSFMLAFGKKGTFSLKYNVIWDKLLNLGLFDEKLIGSELKSYDNHITKYGIPLDNRETYTKSDWQVWVATLADTKEDFEKIIEPLWTAYNESNSRVPMSDWYSTENADHITFKNRTVMGGIWIKLLDEMKILKKAD